MKSKTRKCFMCKTKLAVELMHIDGIKAVCRTADCMADYGLWKVGQSRKSSDLAYKRETKVRKEAIKSRTDLYQELQVQVNKYVRTRDKGKPCCTCGTTNPGIKYDAGHYRSVGSCKDLRFELTNIHRQCSQQCNQYGSGMRKEYSEFVVKTYGQAHLDWLDGPHKALKEQFPTHDSIRDEISRYKQLNKAAQ